MTQRTWAHTHLTKLRRGEPDCISVKCGRSKIRYEERLVLINVVFWVNERGRQETLATGVRGVHAWVVGDETSEPVGFDLRTWRKAVYDPWKGDSFVDAQSLTPIHYADAVVMIGKTVYYR